MSEPGSGMCVQAGANTDTGGGSPGACRKAWEIAEPFIEQVGYVAGANALCECVESRVGADSVLLGSFQESK